MENLIRNLVLITVLAPLAGSLIAGLAGNQIGKRGATIATIAGMLVTTATSAYLFYLFVINHVAPMNLDVYTWATSGSYAPFKVGFLLDPLSTIMILTVNIVSLLVHVYSIGYMEDDSGYQRFFSYMSLFTFFMLILTLANNFLVLFFGWEGVGLVSYLLIGFWYQKPSAASGSLKAFIVNRVGDMGFILGMAAILEYFGSFDYATVFAAAPSMAATTLNLFPSAPWSVITIICILLFIGAMGKSAQVPLHVWLPESMEGPTPISALIHAATMVTAGVYMVARMSPLYELSTVALSVVLIIGATGALFMGLIGVVENDIKRVIAYSTMSQLGYMMAANGASAYTAGIFHLITHAYFKAILFLAAGSVIIAMHHEQNLWKMGNLKKYLPFTYVAFLMGALSLCAIPPFSGFYSKDSIIEAVHLSKTPGAMYAYICLLIATFVTALYIFRAFFLAFHGKERMDEKLREDLHEPSWTMIVPIIILTIPTVVIGAILVVPMLYQQNGLLGNSIYVMSAHNVLAQMAHEYQNMLQLTLNGFLQWPFFFAFIGIFVAWLTYLAFPAWPAVLQKRLLWIYEILRLKYGFDAFNDLVFVRGVRKMSYFFFHFADMKLIDDWMVNGSGRAINKVSNWLRHLQSGYLYHYAFAMIIGLFVFLGWLLIFK